MKTNFRRTAIALSLAASSGLASATDCDSVLSQYKSYIQSALFANAAAMVAHYPTCFGGSPTVAQSNINAVMIRTFLLINQALGLRFAPSAPGPVADAGDGLRGVAAGATPGKWNVWGSVANTGTKQDYVALNVSVKNDNDVLTSVVGADYPLSSSMVAGISASLDRGTGSTKNSAAATTNSLTSKGYTIAPYLGIQLNKDWSADVSAGYGTGDMEMTGGITTNFDRWFAGGNVTYSKWMGNWQYTGKAGLLHAVEDYDSAAGVAGGVNTASKNKIQQAYIGTQVGYWMNGLMPYAGLKFSSDLHRSTTLVAAPVDPIGRGAWVWTAGLNYYSVAKGLTAGIVYNQEEARTNQRNFNVSANLSLKF